MGQVTVTLNGRTYSLLCADGEEARLIRLAGFVQHRAEALVEEFGQVGDDRVLLMAAIMIADELMQVQAVSASTPATSMPVNGPANGPADGFVWARSRKSAR